MKETEFIEQNRDKWIKYEEILNSSSVNPDEIRNLYTELNNDLSYAQTFYEKRKLKTLLNRLTQIIHRKFYKQKKEPFNKVISAWTIDLPIEIYHARKNILFAFVLFAIYFIIGAFSTHHNIAFANKVLGSGYIAMTEENIRNGNPLGVYEGYGDTLKGMMFLQITINNIIVALICFVGGVLFSLGTHVVLFKNAIMVGVFQYYFKLKGLLLTSFLTIWIHGAFEISAIIIASGAGFTVGHGLLFPGSYTRMQALQMSGMRGVRIMISLIPIFFMAGFLEGYVTRGYFILSDLAKWGLIIFSFAFILFYYVIYPFMVARKYPEKVFEQSQVNTYDKIKFVPYKIRKNTEIYREAFQLYFQNFFAIWKNMVKTAIPIIVGIMIYQYYNHKLEYIYYDVSEGALWLHHISLLFGNSKSVDFNGTKDLIVTIAWLIPLSLIALASFYPMFSKNSKSKVSFVNYLKTRVFRMILAILPIYFVIQVVPVETIFPVGFIYPLFILPIASVGLHEKGSLGIGYGLGVRKYGSILVLLFSLVITVFFLMQPIAFSFIQTDYMGNRTSNDVLDWIIEFLLPIFAEFSETPLVWTNFIRQGVYLLFFISMLPVFFKVLGLIYYSAREEREAIGLKEELKRFGNRSRTKESPLDYVD